MAHSIDELRTAYVIQNTKTSFSQNSVPTSKNANPIQQLEFQEDINKRTDLSGPVGIMDTGGIWVTTPPSCGDPECPPTGARGTRPVNKHNLRTTMAYDFTRISALFSTLGL